MNYQIIIAGGGIAGLINAICLSRAGFSVLVIEKETYPFHRVCGEYISNEVLPFLCSIDANPAVLSPSNISKLTVTSPKGTALNMILKSGGFGVSRYTFDAFLFEKAKQAGAVFQLQTKILAIEFSAEQFTVNTEAGLFFAPLVIGSFGKRSALDRQLNRAFFYQKSPYLAVKYHINYDIPSDTIGLHNFHKGYCGISKTESEAICLCYLTSVSNLKQAGTIPAMEETVIQKNPVLKNIFLNASFVFKKPKVIHAISFESKTRVENHILFCGDSAGMISPLCGNGMAIAIHAAKLLSSLIVKYFNCKSGDLNREFLEKEYAFLWDKRFDARLTRGRNIQRLLGNTVVTDATVRLLRSNKLLANWLVRKTHGNPF